MSPKRRFKFSEAVYDPRDEHWKMPEDIKFSTAENAARALPIMAHVLWRFTVYVMEFIVVFFIALIAFILMRG
jgi:hypothetical protein